MPRPSKQDQELGFIRSYWDEIREMEADYTGSVTVYEEPSRRPGVLEIRMVFTEAIGHQDNPLSSCTYKYTFPSAANQTYAASKWVGARALRQVVEDYIRSLPQRRKKKGQA